MGKNINVQIHDFKFDSGQNCQMGFIKLSNQTLYLVFACGSLRKGKAKLLLFIGISPRVSMLQHDLRHGLVPLDWPDWGQQHRDDPEWILISKTLELI